MTDELKKYCKQCQGRGTVATGIYEASESSCRACEGTGYAESDKHTPEFEAFCDEHGFDYTSAYPEDQQEVKAAWITWQRFTTAILQAATRDAPSADDAKPVGWLVRGESTYLYVDNPEKPNFVFINGHDKVVSIEKRFDAICDAPSADAELEITDVVAKELWLVWNAAAASSWESVANKEKYRYPARKAIEAALGWKPRSEWTIGRDEMNAPTRNAPQLAEGWVLTETKNLNGLIIAMERADSKGYMPDAIQSAWDDFMCQPHIAAAPKGDGND